MERTIVGDDYHDSDGRLYRAKSTREIPSGGGKDRKLTIVEAALGQSEPLSR